MFKEDEQGRQKQRHGGKTENKTGTGHDSQFAEPSEIGYTNGKKSDGGGNTTDNDPHPGFVKGLFEPLLGCQRYAVRIKITVNEMNRKINPQPDEDAGEDAGQNIEASKNDHRESDRP